MATATPGYTSMVRIRDEMYRASRFTWTVHADAHPLPIVPSSGRAIWVQDATAWLGYFTSPGASRPVANRQWVVGHTLSYPTAEISFDMFWLGSDNPWTKWSGGPRVGDPVRISIYWDDVRDAVDIDALLFHVEFTGAVRGVLTYTVIGKVQLIAPYPEAVSPAPV